MNFIFFALFIGNSFLKCSFQVNLLLYSNFY